jgi:phosphate transport system substrate-binding protein
MNRVTVIVLASLLFGGLARADEIRVEGGATTISSVFLTVQSTFEAETGHTMNVVQSSAVEGLIALEAGRVDIAAAAHPLEDLVNAAAKEGVEIDKATLVATPLEENRLIAIVHKSNPVKQLSRAQLKDIFTGKVGNWKEVGGNDLDIEVVWAGETKGQNAQFTRVVLDGEPVTSNLRAVKGYRSIENLVAVLPSGIGIIPVSMSSSLIRAPEIPVITSSMYLITKGKPSPKVQQFIDFYVRESRFTD